MTSIVLEWGLYALSPLWSVRRYVVAVPLALTVFGSVVLLLQWWDVWVGVVVVVSAFRLVNQLRIAEGRMQAQYLRFASRRTGLVLGILQLLLLGIVWLSGEVSWPLLLPLAGIQLAVAAGILVTSWRTIAKTGRRPSEAHYADKDLPTVSVAIPARNETTDLEECLRSVLANTYPKLEVLVLDDCSQDKTAEVIRSFAHDGVRFIKGDEPQDRWLAKNQAYDRLANEATGELILFCGVDVRFGPEVVRAIVAMLLDRKKDMVSVLPRRLSSDPWAALIQPMRYWWELALPRRFFNRPAVLSTCWLIRRKSLKELGGFEAVSHAIIPEGYFARELVKRDAYSFVRADEQLDIRTQKSLTDQRETAIRTRYPEVRRRPEWAMLLVMAEVVLLLGPFAAAVSGFWLGFDVAQLLAGIACLLLIITHVAIVQISNPANVVVAVFNLPLAILTEIVMGLASMYQYEFSVVDWKGRNICIPVMHVVPKLPPMREESKSNNV
jgi:glycosyltransferase involved in cell wall biosynthesis